MERTEKTWILEIVLAAILTTLLGLWGWTATKVVENGENIAELNGKMDLLISGLNIEVAPKESAGAAPGAQRSGFRGGAGDGN